MFGLKFLGKTRIPNCKNTAAMPAVRMEPPKEVLLPVCQHIGAPAAPIVKVGDEVKLGQRIADTDAYVSSPIYASVSGKVSKIEDYLRPDGRRVCAIRIVSDGEMTPAPGITPPTVNDLDSLVKAARESGIVGLGGAGFPLSVKLDAAKRGNIDTVILNGAECEPYITTDTRTMLEDAEYIKSGIELLKRCIPTVKAYYIGIEADKPECIKKLTEVFAADDSVKVAKFPAKYPQGAEKVIVYNTTRRVIPEGKLPADVGAIVINVTTLAYLAKYVETGMPLVERSITIDGSAVAEPKNIIVPIGTSIRDIIDFAGGLKEDAGKVIFGGPMMGQPACSLDEPIVKTTGAITVLNVKDSTEPPVTACIHCGRCVNTCPMFLDPTAYAGALKLEGKQDRVQRLEEAKINLCIECGSCSYVCPANRPLVQNNRIAKAEVREYKAHLASLANEDK